MSAYRRFSAGTYPFTSIQPFTYRDSRSFLELLRDMADYLDTVVSEFNNSSESIDERISEIVDHLKKIDDHMALEFMRLSSESEDHKAAIAKLRKDLDQTRKDIEGYDASINSINDSLNNVNNLIDSLTSSVGEIQKKYVKIAELDEKTAANVNKADSATRGVLDSLYSPGGEGQVPSNDEPLMDGAAQPGTMKTVSRSDHRHPTDTSRAPLESPNFTGEPTVPDVAGTENSLVIANTKFVQSKVTALDMRIASKAPLDSAKLAGVPTTPTPPDGDKSLKIANTAFLANVTAKINDNLDLKADIASPSFTGSPTAPTPAASDSSIRVSTTEFVTTAISGKAPINSPKFTGVPQTTEPEYSDNSSQIATTAYVNSKSGVYTGGRTFTTGGFTQIGTSNNYFQNFTLKGTAPGKSGSIPVVHSYNTGTGVDLITQTGYSWNGDEFTINGRVIEMGASNNITVYFAVSLHPQAGSVA